MPRSVVLVKGLRKVASSRKVAILSGKISGSAPHSLYEYDLRFSDVWPHTVSLTGGRSISHSDRRRGTREAHRRYRTCLGTPTAGPAFSRTSEPTMLDQKPSIDLSTGTVWNAPKRLIKRRLIPRKDAAKNAERFRDAVAKMLS